MINTLLIGFLLAAGIGGLAWRLGALAPSGALAAALTGGLIFGFGGLPWAALLLTFFISSSALSRAFRGRKAAVGEKFAKGARRDGAQVLANGGLGAGLAVVFGLAGGAEWAWPAFAGAMAAVNADTWATELGVLSQAPPRLLTTGRVVERGASGGITALGILASLVGAALVGVVGGWLGTGPGFFTLLILASGAGLAGSLFDSLLGATVQAMYYCPADAKETERHPLHTCGAPTQYRRGWRWLNNDGVNFLASVVGALVAVVGWGLM